MIAETIWSLRNNANMTQSELAKRLGITRSSVNAWEMGLNVPSTQFIVELAGIFGVSTDFLLGVEATAAVSVEGLNDSEIEAILSLVRCLRAAHGSKESEY